MRNFIRSALRFISALALIIISILIVILGILWISDEMDTDIAHEISQNIGGTLLIEGYEWMDLQSFGDVINLKYRPAKSKISYNIGDSDYYGRNFDFQKQIVKKKDYYILVVGDRLKGDKIYASKNLIEWQEFIFNRKSILNVENRTNINYIEGYSFPGEVLIIDEHNNLAEWDRNTETSTGNQLQRVKFSFKLNWSSNTIECDNILKKFILR